MNSDKNRTEERWVELQFSGGQYSVSNIGRVYSNRYNRFLSPYKTRFGYMHVYIHKKDYAVHRLVAYGFLGFDLSKGNNKEINHIDGNKENNRVENLEIVTHRMNIRHALESGILNINDGRDVKNLGPISSRLRYYVKEVLKIYPIDFIQKTGVHHSILCGKMKSIKDETLNKITSKFHINPNWVKYGEGSIEIK